MATARHLSWTQAKLVIRYRRTLFPWWKIGYFAGEPFLDKDNWLSQTLTMRQSLPCEPGSCENSAIRNGGELKYTGVLLSLHAMKWFVSRLYLSFVLSGVFTYTA